MRRLLLRMFTPVSKLLSKCHISPSYRYVKADDYHAATELILPGDVLLSTMRGELTNLFIAGHYKHAAMYVGVTERADGSLREHSVVEATFKGVVASDLIDVMLSKDDVMILRPREHVLGTNNSRAADIILSVVGKPYDFVFEPGCDAFYCSELATWALNEAAIESKKSMTPFTKRTTMGVSTVLAQDFADAKKFFDVIAVFRKG